jgi:serine/threonine-protein kinase
MIGRTISHYAILEKLGEGGMGVVYKAEDLVLHRLVALKVPAEQLIRDTDMRERFLNEARMAATLLHQNVTVVHEVGEHEGRPFIVMEFVDGHTLHHAIRDRGPLPVPMVVDIALQLCKGLNAVHDKHVIHRDIKTENVLLTQKNEVKIADCGLAARIAHAGGLEQSLGLAGTTAYMSPEQLRGDPLDERSDVFSVGIVLYEALTGHLPFEADHPAALMYLIANGDPAPIESYRPDVPPAMAAIIYRALAKAPAKRYQNVNEMIRDLSAVGANTQPSTTSVR